MKSIHVLAALFVAFVLLLSILGARKVTVSNEVGELTYHCLLVIPQAESHDELELLSEYYQEIAEVCMCPELRRQY